MPILLLLSALAILLLNGCQLAPAVNVLDYRLAAARGEFSAPAYTGEGASLTGSVTFDGQPVVGAWAIVAERTGRPHAAQTDATGHFRIEGIPPGAYVPAFVAAGFEEAIPPTAGVGLPLIHLASGEERLLEPVALTPHRPAPLPGDVGVQSGPLTHVTAPFPPGAVAQAQSFAFTYPDPATGQPVTVDTLRVYRPLERGGDEGEAARPLLFMVYPGSVEGWEPVSVAYAFRGYTVVAISPIGYWGLDVDAHTRDARIAFALARQGALGDLSAAEGGAVAMGGSFTSAILHRLLRDEGDHFAGWITAGGVSDAFRGAADFYAGRIWLPETYRFLIPALGRPNLFPLAFLRYSPVYTAAQLPPP